MSEVGPIRKSWTFRFAEHRDRLQTLGARTSRPAKRHLGFAVPLRPDGWIIGAQENADPLALNGRFYAPLDAGENDGLALDLLRRLLEGLLVGDVQRQDALSRTI